SKAYYTLLTKSIARLVKSEAFGVDLNTMVHCQLWRIMGTHALQ
ncbi:hypothetical protein AVEN_59107-1, partial [Araneus ventricosus]